MRFWPKYHEFTNLGGLSAKSANQAIGVVTGRTSLSTYLDPAFDIIKFFKIETCKSAAMRQLTENMLQRGNREAFTPGRWGIHPGAAAESDKSSAPRFAHFVDGCNAFFAILRTPNSPRPIPPAIASASAMAIGRNDPGGRSLIRQQFPGEVLGRRCAAVGVRTVQIRSRLAPP